MGSHRVLLSAGSNARGQLGIGSYDDAHTFTPCRFGSAVGCEPELGDQYSSPGSTGSFSDWQLPDPTARVTQIACGANHTILLLESDDGSMTLWGAGDGRRGQLGMGFDEGEDGRAAAVVTEEGVRAAELAPLPSPAMPKEPKSVQSIIFRRLVLPEVLPDGGTYEPSIVGAAWETTYVVFRRRPNDDSSSDVLLSMGSDDFGALGVGSTGTGELETVRVGPQVIGLDHVFFPDRPETPGLRPRVIRVRSLHAGPRHVVAELVVTTQWSSQTTVLVGWGAARHGQLGPDLSGARFVARPTLLPIDVHEDPMVSCALGHYHTVILHASGCVSALGSNKHGQIPSSRRRICRLGCTWSGTYMQTDDEDGQVLLSMGNNAQGQLGLGHTVNATSTSVGIPLDCAISTFVCGSEHVLVAVSNSLQEGKSVLGWGWNEHGNMGLGSLGNVTLPMKLWPRGDIEAYNKCPQKLIGIWAGCATSWLLVE